MQAKIDSLKNSMNTLKVSNSKIITSHNSLAEKITIITHKMNEHSTIINHLSLQNEALITKIDSMETKIEALALGSSISEDPMAEMINRQSRMKNVLLYNLPEAQNDSNNASSDSTTVENILNFLELETKPISIVRVGNPSSNPTRHRPLKLRYSDHEDIFKLFGCQKKLRLNSTWKDLRFASDRTKQQREHMAFLRHELFQRRSTGEQGLVIKYVRGTPMIAPIND